MLDVVDGFSQWCVIRAAIDVEALLHQLDPAPKWQR
jgi:hypothetical protein